MKRPVGIMTAVGLQKVTVLLRHATILGKNEFPNITAPIEVIRNGVIDYRFSDFPIDFSNLKGFRDRDFLFLAKVKIRAERFPKEENLQIWVLFCPRRWRIRFSDNLQEDFKRWTEVVKDWTFEVVKDDSGVIVNPFIRKVFRFKITSYSDKLESRGNIPLFKYTRGDTMLGWKADKKGWLVGPAPIQIEDSVQSKEDSRWAEKMRARWDLIEYLKVSVRQYLEDRPWGLKVLNRLEERKKKETNV